MKRKFCILVTSAEVKIPIANAPGHDSAVDVVKRPGPRPLLLDVVDLELNIWRHAIRPISVSLHVCVDVVSR